MSYDTALAQLRDAGLVVEQLETDGRLIRVPTEDDKARKRSGWYVAHTLRTDDGRELVFGSWGNWRTGISGKLKYNAKGIDDAERERIRAQMARDREAAQQARLELAATAARRAVRIWEGLPDSGSSPYLTRKKARSYGLRFAKGGAVVVPVRAAGGDLVGLQFIDADGGKKFLTGTAKTGAFHWLHEPQGPDEVIQLAEGYATACSVLLATGHATACAFDAGNLLPTAEAIRRLYPHATLVVCADDDHATPGNPGRQKAQECAQRARGSVCLPVFQGERGTDFNDLHVAEGLDAVRACLAVQRDPSVPQGTLREAAEESQPARSVPGGGSAPDAEEDWTARLRRGGSGELKPDIANIVAILEHDTRWSGVLAYCDFSSRVLKRRPPPFRGGAVGEWTDTDTTRLRVWMSETWRCTPKTSDADEAVLMAAQLNRYHPVREYLEACMWDERPRVDGWLSRYLGAPDTEYTRAVGRYWLIAAVARAMKAPCKADCVLILEGQQGLGKSTALKILGGEWYSDTHFQLGEKDGYSQMVGVWICELSELDSFNKAESTRAKQFFASQEDRYRPPYGRRAVTHPRQCVFAGTTNQDSYLKDPTGNRRYWPVLCTRLDAAGLARDRAQLWAEAVDLYLHGARWWPGEDEGGAFGAEQERRYQSDAWEDVIRLFLSSTTTSQLTVAELAKDALKLEVGHLKPPEEQRIGRVMARLGWPKNRRRVPRDGVKQQLWVFERPAGWDEEGDQAA